jgi:4-amino-4-deoxy-L-arabinose transferase-like glycosyltransferase
MQQTYLYFAYSLVIFFITFVPGYLILSRYSSLDHAERVILSPAISIIVLLLLSFLFTSNTAIVFWLLLSVMSIVCAVKCKETLLFANSETRFLLQLVFIFLGVRLLAQTLWEYPVIGGDWSYHGFVLPYQFSLGDWTPPRDRPPVFSILIYAYHRLLGTSLYQFWTTQAASTVLNSLFILPAYFIAKRSFGAWTARVSTLFMAFVPFLVFQSIYTWPKSLAMFCVLGMIYFLFFSESKNKYAFAGVLGGLGFLFHNYAAFYIIISTALLLSPNQISEKLKSSLAFLSPAFLVVLPYLLWLHSYYGSFSTSRFIYYPIAVGGYETALSGNITQLFEQFHATPLSEIVFIRISNAIVTLTPAALPVNPVATSFPTYNPMYYFSHDYPGALSLSIYVLALLWFASYLRSNRKDEITKILTVYLVAAFIINLLLWGWKEWGLVGQILHPTVPILVMFAAAQLKRITGNHQQFCRPMLLFILIDLIAENLIFKKLLEQFYHSTGGVLDVYQGIARFIPDFKIENFISAYFLFQDAQLAITLLLTGLTLWTAYLLLSQKPAGDAK